MAGWETILYGAGLYVVGFLLARTYHMYWLREGYEWDVQPRLQTWPDRLAFWMSSAGAVVMAIGVVVEVLTLFGW